MRNISFLNYFSIQWFQIEFPAGMPLRVTTSNCYRQTAKNTVASNRTVGVNCEMIIGTPELCVCTRLIETFLSCKHHWVYSQEEINFLAPVFWTETRQCW